MLKENVLIDANLKPYVRILGFLTLVLFAIIPFQIAIYFISPPPTSAIGFFEVFQKNVFLGFLDLDLALTIDNLLFVLVYLGLYFVLKESSRVTVTIALIFSIISVTLYIVSREALFSMLNLSNQYSISTNDLERSSILIIGETMLTIYNGTCFNVSYILGGITMVLFSIAMLKTNHFKKVLAYLGLVMGILMLVPPTAGKIGFILSFLSILPLMPWLIIMSIQFFKMSK